MGQVSSTQKWCGGGLVGLVVLAILLYFLVCTSSEGLTKVDESAKITKAVNLCADADAGVWQEGKWHDGEVFFEEDAESEEVCAELGEEWNSSNPENEVTLLTYDHIYKICAGKKPQTQRYTAYKMITLGHCDTEDIETNNISTLSYNKQFDTVIANQGEFVTPNWTDITDGTAVAAATEGLGEGSTAADQCSRGTRWLHNENLLIPNGKWMDCRGSPPPTRLGKPAFCSYLDPYEGGGEGGDENKCDKDVCYNIGAFNPYPNVMENDRAPIQIIKGNPDEVDLRKIQNNDDYEGEDKTYLSVYLQCDVDRRSPTQDRTVYVTTCTNADPPEENKTNSSYNLVEVEQNTRYENTGPIREASDYTYLGSYENDNGSLSQIGGEWRPPPGKEEPFDVDGITNSTTPNGCYVNLDYDTKFTADSPKKTGSLNYNDAFEERDSSRATKLRPKICQATEEVTQSCENDSEFSLLFL